MSKNGLSLFCMTKGDFLYYVHRSFVSVLREQGSEAFQKDVFFLFRANKLVYLRLVRTCFVLRERLFSLVRTSVVFFVLHLVACFCFDDQGS